ncbi:hypothetical protein HGRIS_010416 [Hohenbuehelia grisea]|uniref:Uncharacterized protein n=1 Tax=Hohenbuehelia grisea TaxID=104357 RepID=A0ABR3J4Z0_9AGAR
MFILNALPSSSPTHKHPSSVSACLLFDRWPALLPIIKRMLASSDVRKAHAWCVAALEAIMACRFRQKADILPSSIEKLMPLLVQIAAQMLQTASAPGYDANVPTMLHLILKTYKISIILNQSQMVVTTYTT